MCPPSSSWLVTEAVRGGTNRGEAESSLMADSLLPLKGGITTTNNIFVKLEIDFVTQNKEVFLYYIGQDRRFLSLKQTPRERKPWLVQTQQPDSRSNRPAQSGDPTNEVSKS